MNTVPAEFHDAIPAAIRPLILECSVLPSEDPQGYRNLLIELWELLRPKSALQWLDLKKLVDLTWEGLRLGRIKAEIINSVQKKSLSQLLLSMTNQRVCDFTPSGNVTQAEEGATKWFIDPVAKKEIQTLFAKFNYSQNTIDAVAFIQHAAELATLEKMQMANEARQFAVRRQLEEEQEILQLQPGASGQNGDEKLQQLKARTANDVGEDCEGKRVKLGWAERDGVHEENQSDSDVGGGKQDEADEVVEDVLAEVDDGQEVGEHGEEDDNQADDQEEAA